MQQSTPSFGDRCVLQLHQRLPGCGLCRSRSAGDHGAQGLLQCLAHRAGSVLCRGSVWLLLASPQLLLHQLRLLLSDGLDQPIRFALLAQSQQLDQVSVGCHAQAAASAGSSAQLHIHLVTWPQRQPTQQSTGLADLHFRSCQADCRLGAARTETVDVDAIARLYPGAAELEGSAE